MVYEIFDIKKSFTTVIPSKITLQDFYETGQLEVISERGQKICQSISKT